jgi:hypothetical protein
MSRMRETNTDKSRKTEDTKLYYTLVIAATPLYIIGMLNYLK